MKHQRAKSKERANLKSSSFWFFPPRTSFFLVVILMLFIFFSLKEEKNRRRMMILLFFGVMNLNFFTIIINWLVQSVLLGIYIFISIEKGYTKQEQKSKKYIDQGISQRFIHKEHGICTSASAIAFKNYIGGTTK